MALKRTSPEKSVLNSLRGEVRETRPFWLMRQAGRYLPEYRDLRQKAGSFLGLCFNPEMAAEATLQPVRRFDMDAAIIFSDILVIPYALGQDVNFTEGEGPSLGPLSLESLSYEPHKLEPVLKALGFARQRLSPDKTLIGFAGAPWTVACYMIDRQGGGQFGKAREAAHNNPAFLDGLIGKLVDATTLYLAAQARAGADAVQIFDSWAGLLPEPYFTRWVIEPARQIRRRLKEDCPSLPVIAFPRGAAANYPRYAREVGAEGIGLDNQVSMAWAARHIDSPVCLQGNLDPVLLLKGGAEMESAARKILRAAKDRPFVFNLGHGILKETPLQNVARLAEIIREGAG